MVSSSERLQELVDLKKEIVGYDPTIVDLSAMGQVTSCRMRGTITSHSTKFTNRFSTLIAHDRILDLSVSLTLCDVVIYVTCY